MEPRAKYVLVQKNEILVRSNTELALLCYNDVSPFKETPNRMTFLGILSDETKTPIFGIDILEAEDITSSFDQCFFVDARTSAPLLPPLQNSLALHMMASAQDAHRSRWLRGGRGDLRGGRREGGKGGDRGQHR